MCTVVIPVLIQLGYLRFVAYEVERSVYGNFVLLTSFAYGMSQLFLSIPGQAFSRFYNTAEDKRLLFNEFRSLLLIANLLSLLTIFGFYLIYGERFSLWCYVLIFLFFGISNNYLFSQKLFILNIQRSHYLLFKVLDSLSKYAMPLVLYAILGTVESLLFGLVVGYVLSQLILSFLMKEHQFKFSFNGSNLKKYMAYGYPILLSSAAAFGIAFGDRFFIDTFLGEEDVANYSILAQFSAFAYVFGTVFSVYVHPIILKGYEENAPKALVHLNRYLKIFALALGSLFVGLLLLPRSIFTILVPPLLILEDYYYATFLCLILSAVFAVLQTAISLHMVLEKKLHHHAMLFVGASVINFGLNFFILKYGILAASLATMTAYALLTVAIIWVVVRYQKNRTQPILL